MVGPNDPCLVCQMNQRATSSSTPAEMGFIFLTKNK
jgi:hypothetical protein